MEGIHVVIRLVTPYLIIHTYMAYRFILDMLCFTLGPNAAPPFRKRNRADLVRCWCFALLGLDNATINPIEFRFSMQFFCDKKPRRGDAPSITAASVEPSTYFWPPASFIVLVVLVNMADCSATGSALDRTVRAALASRNNDGAKVFNSLLGQAATTLSPDVAMPSTAPPAFVMPQWQTSQQQTSALPQQAATPTVVATSAGPHLQHPHQPQRMRPPQMHHHPMLQMQQQQQMMAMMNMQMQQQLQYLQHQQQKRRSQQASTEQNEATLDTEGNDETTRAALREHLESSQQGHEGIVNAAGMDELAAAWAEAEAAYQDELDAVEQATNLAAGLGETATTTAPPPYEFTSIDMANPPENVDQMDWMDHGRRHFAQGNIPQAIVCFETQLLHCHDMDNVAAWRLLGQCHAENDQDREAIICLAHAVDRDPYDQEALLALAVSHVNELNHAKALEVCQAWITHNPQYGGMELTEDLYGDSSTNKTESVGGNAFDDVQRLLLRALEYDPSNAAAILQALGVICKLPATRGLSLHEKNECQFFGMYLLILIFAVCHPDNVNRDYEAAANAFRRALETRPNDYELWNKLGATLANGNRSEKALPAYQRALELRPRYARAWLNMAISYSNLHNYEEAARCYLQTLSLNPAALHCWSYLRIALSCSEQWDLIPLAASHDLAAFQEHYDFVLYH